MRRFFTWLASRSAYLMGHPAAFLIAVLACLLWAVTGPMFDYSDTWQLVINTATTVLTFLAVFLIQNSQNRDGVAIQAKLDEILMAVSKARTELVGIENLTDAEVMQLKSAIEREALQPEAKPDKSTPTVDEILEGRNLDVEKKIEEMPAADRRKVAQTAKRAVAAAAQKVKSEKKKNGRKTAARAASKKRVAGSRR
jgi:low affinity Fe/Cu permease